MVPAASSSNWLKSRLFSGSSLTAWLERRFPPVAAAWVDPDAEFAAVGKLNTADGAPGWR